MRGSPLSPLARQARLLSRVIKLVRAERRLSPREVAVAMGVSLRTYQDFEAGRREFDFSKVRKFARATRVDPFGLLMAIYLRDPSLALLVMDNKMPMAFYVAMRRLRSAVGDEFTSIPAAQVMLAMRPVEDHMLAFVARRRANAEDWLEQAFAEILDDPPEDNEVP